MNPIKYLRSVAKFQFGGTAAIAVRALPTLGQIASRALPAIGVAGSLNPATAIVSIPLLGAAAYGYGHGDPHAAQQRREAGQTARDATAVKPLVISPVIYRRSTVPVRTMTDEEGANAAPATPSATPTAAPATPTAAPATPATSPEGSTQPKSKKSRKPRKSKEPSTPPAEQRTKLTWKERVTGRVQNNKPSKPSKPSETPDDGGIDWRIPRYIRKHPYLTVTGLGGAGFLGYKIANSSSNPQPNPQAPNNQSGIVVPPDNALAQTLIKSDTVPADSRGDATPTEVSSNSTSGTLTINGVTYNSK